VRGIRLLNDDAVAAMDVATEGAQLLILTARGYGKRTIVDHFRTTGRGVQGVIALKITDKTGPIAAAVITGPDVEEVMVGSSKAMVYRTAIKEIRTLGRNTQGVQVMTKLQATDRVISMSAFKERSWDNDDNQMPKPTPGPATSGTRVAPAAAPNDSIPDEPTGEDASGSSDSNEEIYLPQGQLGFSLGDEEPEHNDGNPDTDDAD